MPERLGPSPSVTGEAALDDAGPRVERRHVGQDLGQVGGSSRVDLVDDHDVGPQQAGLTRVVRELMTGPQRVDDGDLEVGDEEGEVVVASVPDDNVTLCLGLAQDLLVVDPGVHHHAHADGLLVLLAFLHAGMGGVDLGHRCEALHSHGLEVPIGHRVAHKGDPQSRLEEYLAHPAGGLALATPGPDGADGHHRLDARQHRGRGPEKAEVRPCRQDGGGLVHHVHMRQIRVGENDFVDVLASDEVGQLCLRDDGNAVGIKRAGKRCRVRAVVDAGNLSGGEGHNLRRVIVAEHGVEVVEVAPSGA